MKNLNKILTIVDITVISILLIYVLWPYPYIYLVLHPFNTISVIMICVAIFEMLQNIFFNYFISKNKL